ncbi:uncharacterized protein Hap1MRO34_023563 [Clarias gariepinus]
MYLAYLLRFATEDATPPPHCWPQALYAAGAAVAVCGVCYYLYTTDPVQSVFRSLSSIEDAVQDQFREPAHVYFNVTAVNEARHQGYLYSANQFISEQNAMYFKRRSDLISQIAGLQESVNRLSIENSLYSEGHERVVNELMDCHQKLLIQETKLKLAVGTFSQLRKRYTD